MRADDHVQIIPGIFRGDDAANGHGHQEDFEQKSQVKPRRYTLGCSSLVWRVHKEEYVHPHAWDARQ